MDIDKNGYKIIILFTISQQLASKFFLKTIKLIRINPLSFQGFSLLLEHLPDLEAETPLIKSQIASLGGRAVTDEIVQLVDLAELMENGVCYPLFLLCLQKMAKEKDKEWLERRG